MGGSRWRVETEKSDVGVDEYETRTWAGWHHHIAMCLLAGAFLLTLQQDWGEKVPQITRPQVYRVVRELPPKERFGPEELLGWLVECPTAQRTGPTFPSKTPGRPRSQCFQPTSLTPNPPKG